MVWIGWGNARPAGRAAEGKLTEKWNLLAEDGFADLIPVLQTSRADERFERPEQALNYIESSQARKYLFVQLAERLRNDRPELARGDGPLELASNALTKACVDNELQAVGRREGESDRTIPPEVFYQAGATLTVWDTIEAEAVLWHNVRFRYSDVLRLWPARQAEPAETTATTESLRAPDKPKRDVPRTDYRDADVPLIAKMQALIVDGRAQHATDAARAVLHCVASKGNDTSKVRRLARRYRKRDETC
jgi:hypothetical protein